MKQLSLDIAEIKQIVGDKYTSRNKASLICLADEKTHHILYSGDNYELGNLLAYAVALFAKDECNGDIHSFVSHFTTAIFTAYNDELKRPSEDGDETITEVSPEKEVTE